MHTRDNKRSISTVRSPSTGRGFCHPIISLRPGSGKKTRTAPLVGQWRVLHLRRNRKSWWHAGDPSMGSTGGRVLGCWLSQSVNSLGKLYHITNYYQLNHIIYLLTKLEGFRTPLRCGWGRLHTKPIYENMNATYSKTGKGHCYHKDLDAFAMKGNSEVSNSICPVFQQLKLISILMISSVDGFHRWFCFNDPLW